MSMHPYAAALIIPHRNPCRGAIRVPLNAPKKPMRAPRIRGIVPMADSGTFPHRTIWAESKHIIRVSNGIQYKGLHGFRWGDLPLPFPVFFMTSPPFVTAYDGWTDSIPKLNNYRFG